MNLAPDPTQLLADFTVGGRYSAPILTLYRVVNGRRKLVDEFEVSGRRDARQTAEAAGATPWNF